MSVNQAIIALFEMNNLKYRIEKIPEKIPGDLYWYLYNFCPEFVKGTNAAEYEQPS